MRRRKSYKYIYGILVVFIGIGFAYLTANLNINGIGSFGSQSWDIHFENVVVDNTSYNPVTPTISNDDLTITFASGLRIPGDYYKFNVDIVNDGTLDAMFDAVNVTATSDFSNYIDYTITYQNGESLAQYDMLPANSSKTITVNFFYKDIDLSDLPTEEMELSFTLEFNYLMANENAHSVATFKPGLEVSASMIALSNTPVDEVPAYVSAFKKSSELKAGLTDDNIISTSDSDKPIYMWFEINQGEESLGTIYWYSDADVVYMNEDSSYFFNYCEIDNNYFTIYFEELSDISGLLNVNSSKLKSIDHMFFGCSQLSNFDSISSWDTSNVTNMELTFYDCQMNSLLFASNWNTSKLENMHGAFESCSKITDLTPLSNWNISKVTDMSALFYGIGASSLNGIGNWNISSVTNMSSMFDSCDNLTDISALANWNVSNVENMYGLFSSCDILADVSALSNWNTGNVKNMSYMFELCKQLNDVTPLSNWNTIKVTDMRKMFYYCSALRSATALNSWNTSSVNDMDSMFDNSGVSSSNRPSWYS